MMEKENIIFYVISILSALATIAIVALIMNSVYVARDYECYISHVQECQYCHSDNKTYHLCSGFCSEPKDDDLRILNSCLVTHPTENCFDLPKECNLP